ncbi:hypothetical protein CXG81DRAFT_18054 [Caulochytrium protostelioides]|uniref:Uncharacterized protein n=1 Tax=Caulochytrium protostelioides TaxID=1555241 RepID=A0A4P9XAE8_9FUNG|nr:hypothetical protein CXG81DRAFT_18054 [Caulochytrium protostelioides]|eukprot:RKP02306.1 hypothetical protein CXG81DRAFT_18054 [Caulochytrium protostelioides]
MKTALDPITFILRVPHVARRHENAAPPADLCADSRGIPFQTVIRAATRSNMEVSMTKEEYDEAVHHHPCYYCHPVNGTTHQNGLNRVDPSLHYTVDNVVACYGLCILMKSQLTMEQFLQHCTKIADHTRDRDLSMYDGILRKRRPLMRRSLCSCAPTPQREDANDDERHDPPKDASDDADPSGDVPPAETADLPEGLWKNIFLRERQRREVWARYKAAEHQDDETGDPPVSDDE